MIKVEEFMTSDLCTLRETDSISNARKIMTEKHIRHIPVTDSNSYMVGLVTQRDVLAATDSVLFKQEGADSSVNGVDTCLADIMIRDVSIIKKTDSLRKAAMHMQSHKYGCLPVVSDGRLVGIITDSDFIDIAINLIEQAEFSEDEMGAEEVL